MLRSVTVKVSVLGYFPLPVHVIVVVLYCLLLCKSLKLTLHIINNTILHSIQIT